MTPYNLKTCIFMVCDVRKYTCMISNAQAHARTGSALLADCSHHASCKVASRTANADGAAPDLRAAAASL